MSHITDIELKILDLNALKAACREVGVTFNEGAETFTSYQDGLKCEHSITSPWGRYQIGVLKAKDGKGYTLAWDSYCQYETVKKLGEGLEKLKQAYGVCKATIEARARGWSVHRQNLPNGTIKLVMTGAGL